MKHDKWLDSLLGVSAAFQEAKRHVSIYAAATAPVLLLGETGTGKDLFARAIHYGSRRANRPFVPLNCGAVPDALIENELFGHHRGAFTDAAHSHDGLIALANGGTLFLDEIDCLSLPAQAKLLRLLQDGEYRPLGSSQFVRADIRIIAATNANVEELVAKRAMREDLFHRINVLRLCIPPLRERQSDIVLLAKHFLADFERQYGRLGLYLSPRSESALAGYKWPGNVRELQCLVHRSVVLASATETEIQLLGLPVMETQAVKPNRLEGELPRFNQAKQQAVLEFERIYLCTMLVRHSGNVSQAARHAGKERRSFQRLLTKHGIQRNNYLH